MTMKNATLLPLIAVLLISCASSTPSASSQMQFAPPSDILGIHLGMSRDDVRVALSESAKFGREERRNHEVWIVENDPRFASLIIGYTKEWKVRFVTAVAKPDGVAVPYAEVLDLASASHKAAGETHTYTWVTGTPSYSVIAIGGPERLAYLSLEDDQP